MESIPTSLDRRYILIQIKEDRDGCQAVVPVHPVVLELPETVRMDEAVAKAALETAKGQFEVEANAYAEALLMNGYNEPSLRMDEFRRIGDKWKFGFAPFREMLRLEWEFGDDRPNEIGFCPVVLVNNSVYREKFHPEQAKIEQIEIVPNVSIFYGSTRADDYLLWPREMMKEYARKGELPEPFAALGLSREVCTYEHGSWMTELPVSALCSTYTLNVPQALLLRNWAVEYHNRLLDKAFGNVQ